MVKCALHYAIGLQFRWIIHLLKKYLKFIFTSDEDECRQQPIRYTYNNIQMKASFHPVYYICVSATLAVTQ